MRVLVAHNRYRSTAPSGENRVVDLEVAGLRAAGIAVTTFLPTSDELRGAPSTVSAAVRPLLPAGSLKNVRAALDDVCPDVVHLHNPYPLVSPGIIDLAHARGIPVLITLHNARYFCMKGTMQREGRLCVDCATVNHPGPGILHSCYRGSHVQSSMMALALVRNRPRFDRATRYLAVSSFIAEKLVSAGLPAEKVRVKANGVPDVGDPPRLGRDVLYVGRLDSEKGILDLLTAWSMIDTPGRRLIVVGSGELESEVRRRATGLASVEIAGFQPPSRLHRFMAQAGVVVVPSRVPETFGMSVVEAFAAGRPVIATPEGALPELVGNEVGWLVETVADLKRCLSGLEDAELAVRGAAARRRFLARFTLDHSIRQLIWHYEDMTRLGTSS